MFNRDSNGVDASCIIHKETRQVISLKRRKGVYTLEAELDNGILTTDAKVLRNADQGFIRQG